MLPDSFECEILVKLEENTNVHFENSKIQIFFSHVNNFWHNFWPLEINVRKIVISIFCRFLLLLNNEEKNMSLFFRGHEK